MPKNKVSEWSSTAASNTDIGGIDIAEGCAPSGINNAIRELMAQVKDQQTGTDADNFTVGGNLTVTGTTTLSTVLPVVSGGTGASTASAARTSLELGTIATQASSSVSITGGSITGITDLAVADGGTGASTLSANAVLLGNGTSALQTVAPSTSGNVLTSNGTTWTSAQLNRLTSDTAQASTSGTSIDFTGIPSWVKRITVMVTGVSSSGSSNFQIQLGTSSGVVSTGYACGWTFFGTSTVTPNTATTGFVFTNNGASETTNTLINICNVNSNNWMTSFSNSTSTGRASITGGNISLSGTLDRVRITTVNGTDTFDAGSINIMYE